MQQRRELLKRLLLGLTAWITLIPNNSDRTQSLAYFRIYSKKVLISKYKKNFLNATDMMMRVRVGMMMTMRQGLWTNLMEPRQRHGDSRGFEGSTLGSWQILASKFFISIFPWGQAALSIFSKFTLYCFVTLIA